MLSEDKEWQDALTKSEKRLEKIPVDLLHDGPRFEFLTNQGEKIICETKFFYFKNLFGSEGFLYSPTEEFVNGVYCYVFVNNEKGDTVALRTVPLTKMMTGLEARSKIIVKEKGKGYAKPTDEAFVGTLQWFANRLKQKITWVVHNENLEELEELEHNPKATADQLEQKRAEQARWQSLYGEGGYFKIQKGKRVFEPEQDSEAIVSDTRKKMNLG